MYIDVYLLNKKLSLAANLE